MAQASAVAVVSCPATSSVISSSRSSSSVIGLPSSWRACSSSERMSSRSSRSAARAALADLLVDQLVGRRSRPPRTGWSAASRCGPSTASIASGAGSSPHSSALAEAPRAGDRAAFVVLHAEDGADDHLERDRLHRGARRSRAARRPALDLRRLRPRPSSARSRACAPRGRTAASACAGTCARPRRAAAPSGAPAAAAARRWPRRRGAPARRPVKTCLIASGSARNTQVPSLRDPQREHVAVAPPAVLEHRTRAVDPAQRLKRARRGRAGRDGGVHIPEGI